MPAAETSCRVWPGPASGSGTSTTVRTSGPPNSVIWTARMQVRLGEQVSTGAATDDGVHPPSRRAATVHRDGDRGGEGQRGEARAHQEGAGGPQAGLEGGAGDPGTDCGAEVV